MSAFSTISALRRRRPEGLPEGNAAAGGGLQGVACRGWLAGSGSQGVACRGWLAGSGSQGGGLPGAPCWGGCLAGGGLAGGGLPGAPCRERLAGGALLRGASQGAPRRGRWRTATPSEGCSRFWLSAPTRSGPLRPAPARSGPTSPATGRLSGLSSPQGTSPLRSVAPPPERPLPPARLHFGDAPPPPHARNHATSQPRNHATTQPRNHAATQPPQPLSHAKRALPAWGEPFCIGMASCAYPRNESRIPAATAEPTTPATLGPMACISR